MNMKTKKTLLNFITDIIPLIIVTILGLFKSKLLIRELSTNMVGLYQLFSQLLGYVTIFESGITGALLYKLFKPVKQKNQKQVNILFYTGIKVFNIIAIIMVVVGILFSLFIPYLIKDNPFSLWYIMVTFLMYISTNIIYYMVVSHKVLLEAEEKKYITNFVIESFTVLKSFLEIVVLILFKNLIILLSVGILTTIFSSILLVILCKKNNPNLVKTKEKDYSILRDVKNLFIHKIAYLVNNNVDLILITKFIGLGSVVVYSSYNFIISSLKKFSSKIYVSVVPSLGNILVDDKKKATTIFYEMNDFMFFIAILLCTSLLIVINPFINIWYSGKINTSFILAVGFVLILFISIVIQPLLAFTDAGGCFSETKKCAVMEAVINLTLSIILMRVWGIFGILIATFIGYTISDSIVRAKVICDKVLNISIKKYYFDLFLYYMIFLGMCIMDIYLFKFISFTNISIWFGYSILIFLFNFVIIFMIYKLLHRTLFANRLINLLKRK